MLTRINIKKKHYELLQETPDEQIAKEFVRWDTERVARVDDVWNDVFSEIFDIKVSRIQFYPETVISLAFLIKRGFNFVENDEVILEKDMPYGDNL